MFPASTFKNCGTSSIDHRRNTRPTAVMRGSSGFFDIPTGTSALSPAFIVRSFQMENSFPSRPILFCTNTTGLPIVSNIANAPTTTNGTNTTNATTANTTSKLRFNNRCPSERCTGSNTINVVSLEGIMTPLPVRMNWVAASNHASTPSSSSVHISSRSSY